MANFYFDHDVAREIAFRLRSQGHSARTAQDLSLQRAGDDEHLILAAKNDWVFITHNAKDFQLLHNAWRRWAREWGVSAQHAGILVLIPPNLSDQCGRRVDLARSG